MGFSRSRSVQLTKIISLLLKVYNRGVKWGLTMRHTSNIDKVEQLGRAYDEKVLKWRAEQEWHQKFQTTLETISECIEECEAPLGDDHLSRRLKIAYTHFNETVKNDLSKQLANITTVDSTKLDEVRVLQEEINSKRPSGYQIIGDNRDLLIKVRHQASAKPNKGIHCFHLNAVRTKSMPMGTLMMGHSEKHKKWGTGKFCLHQKTPQISFMTSSR